MLPIADLLVTIGGLVIPPGVDLLKRWLGKGQPETPEATLNTLATTKPEVLPEYAKAQAAVLESQAKFFNRDVVGAASSWVVDLRAAIRPIGVIIAFMVLIAMVAGALWFPDRMVALAANDVFGNLVTGVRLSCEGIVASWFGSRISISG